MSLSLLSKSFMMKAPKTEIKYISQEDKFLLAFYTKNLCSTIVKVGFWSDSPYGPSTPISVSFS